MDCAGTQGGKERWGGACNARTQACQLSQQELKQCGCSKAARCWTLRPSLLDLAAVGEAHVVPRARHASSIVAWADGPTSPSIFAPGHALFLRLSCKAGVAGLRAPAKRHVAALSWQAQLCDPLTAREPALSVLKAPAQAHASALAASATCATSPWQWPQHWPSSKEMSALSQFLSFAAQVGFQTVRDALCAHLIRASV